MSVYYCHCFADGGSGNSSMWLAQEYTVRAWVVRHLKWVLPVHYDSLPCHSAEYCQTLLSTAPHHKKKICKSAHIVQSKETSNFISINWPLVYFWNILGHKRSLIICFVVIRFNQFAVTHFHWSNCTLGILHIKLFYAGKLRQFHILLYTPDCHTLSKT